MFSTKLSAEPFLHIIKVDDERAVFEIDTKRAEYNSTKWKNMNSWERRRFENILFLDNPGIRKQFRYV